MTEYQGEEQEEQKYRIPAEERVRVDKLPYKVPTKLRGLLDGFKWAVNYKKQSCVLITDGRSGMGKTTLSFQIAKYMSKSFCLENVHYTPESFLEGLTKTKKGDTLVFDEAMLLSSRAALSQINRMIVIAMSMIRSKNLCIIFNVNSVFDLDKNLALSRADLLLHCYGASLTDKGKFLAFFKGSGADKIKQLYIHGKKYYSYAFPKSNFNTTFSSYFVVDEEEYERRKQIGVNNFLKGTVSRAETKYIRQRNALLYIVRENTGLTLQKIEEKLASYGIKMAYNTISDACRKFEDEMDKNTP